MMPFRAHGALRHLRALRNSTGRTLRRWKRSRPRRDSNFLPSMPLLPEEFPSALRGDAPMGRHGRALAVVSVPEFASNAAPLASLALEVATWPTVL